ncbi:MAG: type II toxin-antitoxin system CcdA family antitoxin [Comamonadaceae bacterium]|nr:type II toxin-antitoxin system CcdA family antitoxin [Comamonadaceae bacterium]
MHGRRAHRRHRHARRTGGARRPVRAAGGDAVRPGAGGGLRCGTALSDMSDSECRALSDGRDGPAGPQCRNQIPHPDRTRHEPAHHNTADHASRPPQRPLDAGRHPHQRAGPGRLREHERTPEGHGHRRRSSAPSAGAVIGTATGGSAGTGAAIGGVVGAVAGNLWSKRMEDKREAMDARPPPAPASRSRARTDNQLKVNVPSDFSFDVGQLRHQAGACARCSTSSPQGLDATMRVRIVGHTDSTRQRRHQPSRCRWTARTSVRDYLSYRGLAPARVDVSGRGASRAGGRQRQRDGPGAEPPRADLPARTGGLNGPGRAGHRARARRPACIIHAHSSWRPGMLRFDDAPKKATNLSLNSKVLELARELGMNVSATVDTLLAEEVRRRYWERWNEENKAAIAHYNARIAREGLPLAKYRSFMKGR